uniref:UBA domain-containing protein n=1 Tax=Acrobeloides nanus TaxID=290746 RepID=A0A914C436_9BILA
MSIQIPGLYQYYSTSGFRHASFSKLWLLLSGTGSFVRVVSRYAYSFTLNDSLSLKTIGKALWTSWTAKSVPELLFMLTLIYAYRKIERRFGTYKFINCIIVTYTFSWLVKFLILYGVSRSGVVSLSEIPIVPSPFTLIYALYFIYLCEFAAVPTDSIMGILPVSIHHIPLIAVIQTLSTESFLHSFIPGLITGLAYRSKLFSMQRWKLIPKFLAALFKDNETFLGSIAHWFETLWESNQGKILPVAALLERQKIEEADELERRLYAYQFRNSRGDQQHLPMNNIILNQLFARQGMAREAEPPEELINLLADMGFPNRNEVINALRQSNNDVSVAANLLLRR